MGDSTLEFIAARFLRFRLQTWPIRTRVLPFVSSVTYRRTLEETVGAHNKRQGDFLNALSDDCEQYGKLAIPRTRHQDPLGYLRVVASLMPRDVETRLDPSDDLSDDERETAILNA